MKWLKITKIRLSIRDEKYFGFVFFDKDEGEVSVNGNAMPTIDQTVLESIKYAKQKVEMPKLLTTVYRPHGKICGCAAKAKNIEDIKKEYWMAVSEENGTVELNIWRKFINI